MARRCMHPGCLAQRAPAIATGGTAPMQFCIGACYAAPMLDWDDLRFYLAIARAGSLSGAARTLGVTQPTAGRRLAAFEKSLGARLFSRTPAGHVPTPIGARLLAYAERMEADAIAAERLASGADAGVRGQVRVTASEWMIDRVLAPLVAPLLAQYPGLSVELAAEARHLSLVRREADIAVRPSRFEHQEVIESPVAVLGFGVYASDGYLAERGMPDFSRGAEGHRLIAMSESLTKIPDVEWLPRIVARADVVLRSNGRIPMATLAARGVGLVCLPRYMGDATPTLRRVSTKLAEPERTLFVAMHQDGRRVPRIRATLAFLKESLRRLQPALRGSAS
jgi:DNA-binding transcriptional LysR family regulator